MLYLHGVEIKPHAKPQRRKRKQQFSHTEPTEATEKIQGALKSSAGPMRGKNQATLILSLSESRCSECFAFGPPLRRGFERTEKAVVDLTSREM